MRDQLTTSQDYDLSLPGSEQVVNHPIAAASAFVFTVGLMADAKERVAFVETPFRIIGMRFS